MTAGDPYLIPGTTVLQNHYNTTDAAELAKIEDVLSYQRSRDVPPDIPLTTEGLQQIHKHLFSDVYPWAGEIRTVDLSKGDSMFARPDYIVPTLSAALSTIPPIDKLRQTTPADFAKRAAAVVENINAAHPFREGNGRTMRVFLKLLAERAGHWLDIERIDKRTWLDGSIQSFRAGDNRLLAASIEHAIIGKIRTMSRDNDGSRANQTENSNTRAPTRTRDTRER